MVSLAAFKTPDPPDEVGVQIGSSSLLGGLFGGSTYKFWHSIEIKRAVDVYSTVTLTAPFEHDRKEFRDTFKPFSYNPVVVTIDDGTIFTGTLIDVDPQVGPDSSVVSATAYARPGVLADCCAPPDLWPLEFNKLKLRVIAEKLCKPFGFGVSVTGEQGAAFARVALDPEQKIQDFLAELAKLRNLVMADTPGGDLWFRKSVSTGSPVAKLKGQPLVSVKAQFNPQDYFSEITGIAKATRKKKGGKYTVKNDHLSGVLRPFTFKPDDLERADIPGAARSKFGRMFGNMVSYTATLPTWRDPDGVLFEPNTTIKITAPDAMIYRETEFLIREVTLKQTADSKTAELGLSLPGAFSGEAPSVFPWE